MKPEDRFEKIWIDLREFGWGIREVPVIWPDDHGSGQPGQNSVGSDELKDDSVEMVDLSQRVKDKMMTGDDRVTDDELNSFVP